MWETGGVHKRFLRVDMKKRDNLADLGVDVRIILTFWRRNYFLILAHPVYKM